MESHRKLKKITSKYSSYINFWTVRAMWLSSAGFQVNMLDERFNAIFEDPRFNIDPSSAHFKDNDAMQQLLQEKVERSKKRKAKEDDVRNIRKKEKRSREDVQDSRTYDGFNLLTKSKKRESKQRKKSKSASWKK